MCFPSGRSDQRTAAMGLRSGVSRPPYSWNSLTGSSHNLHCLIKASGNSTYPSASDHLPLCKEDETGWRLQNVTALSIHN
ncbi:unnamed protein product [Victoria cruziana]